MSDPAATNQPPQSSPGSPVAPRPESGSAVSRSGFASPAAEGQPTVITQRAPLSVSAAGELRTPMDKWGLKPHDRLGHYELIDFVGGGGMGTVFRALDTRLAREVALKVLAPELAADANTVLRFQNEAQSAARLDHQNIARVHYVGEDHGIPFIVFEFIEGGNVRQLVVKKGPLPLSEALSYTLQVSEGLAHAASRNVVHRDIKPSNILITAGGVAKLIDLGLARLQRLDAGVADLTASGMTLGTFDYISPEQARDPRSADVRSDIYSLGCTLFFMLTGQPPFPEGTVLQKLLHHQSDPAPEIRQLRPDVPESFARVLRRMMAKDPRQRYPNPIELAAELAALAPQVGLELHSPQARDWAARQQPKGPRWLRHIPWALPLLMLLTVTVIMEWSSKSDEYGAPPSASPNEPAKPEPVRNSAGASAAATSPESAAKTGAAEPSVTGSSPASAGAQPSSGATRPSLSAAIPDGLSSRLHLEPSRAGIALAEPATGGIALADLGRLPEFNAARPEAKTSAMAAIPVKQAGTLVVGEYVAGERGFATLSAACAAAVSGNSIELRYNGRRVERPVALGNLKLVIRSAEKYQPVIVFQPDTADPQPGSRSMIGLGAGQVTLINVAFELNLPRDASAEGWSLFEILPAETIHLNRCSLTIRTPAGQNSGDAAFFRLRPPPVAGTVARDTAAPPTTIELDDTVARGEAVFVHTEAQQPLVLTWDNGLLATSESLLWAEGSAEPAAAGDVCQLDLRHLTAVTGGPLCRVTGGPAARHLPLVRVVQSSNSIFMGTESSALIEQSGVESVDELRRGIEWNGNHNFYQGWGTLWKVSGADPKTAPVQMDFGAWQNYWRSDRESLPVLNQVMWKKLPAADRAVDARQVSDYALDRAATNPALGAGSDGQDAGMKPDSLPLLPASP